MSGWKLKGFWTNHGWDMLFSHKNLGCCLIGHLFLHVYHFSLFGQFLYTLSHLLSWPIDVWLQVELGWVKCIFPNSFHFPHTISELQPCAENRMILIKKYFHFIKPKAPKIKFDPTSKLWVVFEGMCAKNDKLSNFLGYYEKNGINFLKQFLFRCFQPVGLFLTDTGRVLLLV